MDAAREELRAARTALAVVDTEIEELISNLAVIQTAVNAAFARQQEARAKVDAKCAVLDKLISVPPEGCPLLLLPDELLLVIFNTFTLAEQFYVFQLHTLCRRFNMILRSHRSVARYEMLCRSGENLMTPRRSVETVPDVTSRRSNAMCKFLKYIDGAWKSPANNPAQAYAKNSQGIHAVIRATIGNKWFRVCTYEGDAPDVTHKHTKQITTPMVLGSYTIAFHPSHEHLLFVMCRCTGMGMLYAVDTKVDDKKSMTAWGWRLTANPETPLIVERQRIVWYSQKQIHIL